MGSHHEVYEVGTQVVEVGKDDDILSRSRNHRRAYRRLLKVLAPFELLRRRGLA